jgi:hypothetical protein
MKRAIAVPEPWWKLRHSIVHVLVDDVLTPSINVLGMEPEDVAEQLGQLLRGERRYVEHRNLLGDLTYVTRPLAERAVMVVRSFANEVAPHSDVLDLVRP